PSCARRPNSGRGAAKRGARRRWWRRPSDPPVAWARPAPGGARAPCARRPCPRRARARSRLPRASRASLARRASEGPAHGDGGGAAQEPAASEGEGGCEPVEKRRGEQRLVPPERCGVEVAQRRAGGEAVADERAYD